MFLLCEAEDEGGLINALIYFRICSTQYVLTLLFCTYKVTQRVPISEYSSIFITYAPSFILGRLSLE